MNDDDVDFGAFVSVPPLQDPLHHLDGSTSVHSNNNHSWTYFDHFTKTAAERNKRHVLDELLEHQDDPMYFLDTHDDALADALTSDLHTPKLIRTPSVKVPPSPSRSRLPLPPHLTESTSTSTSTSSTPTSSSSATLSRISSSLVSLLPRPRSTTPTVTRSTLTHGSPFASTPYIPPTGAPGFAGDHTWDHGFSDALSHDEKVDRIGLGITTEMSQRSKGVLLLGRWDTTARVLTQDIADLIRPHLPALTRLPKQWTLLYSLDQHGISLNTLYSHCAPRIPSRACPSPPKGGLLVLQDARDAVFGAWLSEGVRMEKGGYYGSGDAFLWRYHPSVDGERQGRLDAYRWTGKNAYVALCEPGFISFGGGDGHYGLYIDASLLDGSSAPCPTFGNPPLCTVSSRTSKDVSFECVGLEVWGIGPG